MGLHLPSESETSDRRVGQILQQHFLPMTIFRHHSWMITEYMMKTSVLVKLIHVSFQMLNKHSNNVYKKSNYHVKNPCLYHANVSQIT